MEAASIILAQVDPTSGLGTTLAPWANLTAVAALIFFLGWILVREMPRVREAQAERDKLFTEALANVISRFEAQMQLQREHDERQTEKIEDALWGRVAGNGRDRSGGG